MPNSDSIVASADISPPAFVCSHANIGLDAAWVHVAGELDTLTGTTDAVQTADVDPGDPPVQALRHLRPRPGLMSDPAMSRSSDPHAVNR